MKPPLKSSYVGTNFTVRMTPLIDVVFLLMIFFIMTLNFLEPEGVLENRLPETARRTVTDQQKDWEIVHIHLSDDSARPRIYLQEREINDLKDLLHSLNLLPRDIMIVIDPDSKVAYKHVIDIYNTCLKSKKTNIAFSISRDN
jgi:biopolymer transport protein ExbD